MPLSILVFSGLQQANAFWKKKKSWKIHKNNSQHHELCRETFQLLVDKQNVQVLRYRFGWGVTKPGSVSENHLGQKYC